ncbi:uncharacterized protein LOC129614451 [Condylostylus longicornis]|uniref:uncharacterized protein LOC129614451 n=1 Tax=Condylostylus longicornis TaxID=2530218 RepID=UPI00244DD1B8|nr:uncharacterized protein LOC129614451 [Condylostylus longicornis]
MSPSQRTEVVRRNQLCLNCLLPGQMLATCPSKHSCFHCKRRHHTMTHFEQNDRGRDQVPNQNSSVTGNSAASQSQTLNATSPTFNPSPNLSVNTSSISKYDVLLATAQVKLLSSTGQEIVIRMLIDQGSQALFITERIVQLLHLKKESISAIVQGIGNHESHHIRARVNFVIKSLLSKESIEMQRLVMRNVAGVLPGSSFSTRDWNFIKELPLADSKFNETGGIDLLIGADIFGQILVDSLIKDGMDLPIAQNTVFGWMLSGRMGVKPQNNIILKTFHVGASFEDQLRAFWELEKISDGPRILSKEEEL